MEEYKFWLCWVEGTDGGFHYNHKTLTAATLEAERLVRVPSSRGHKIYVLESVSYCEVPESPIVWHELKDGNWFTIKEV